MRDLCMKSTNISTESLFDLFQSRRTCYQFLDKNDVPVDDTKINICLQSAIWAPNHKLTQPWRFWVIGEKTKPKFADIYSDNRAQKKSLVDASCYEKFYQSAFDKFMAIPKVILVGQQLNKCEITQKEDYAACACAIQNFQLMAWQQGLGVQWSTGPIISDKRTYQELSVDMAEIELIGALYIGNIDNQCVGKNTPKRKTLEEVTVYLD